MTQSQRKKVFISYSHLDKEWLNRLLVHLKPLEQEGAIKPWSDKDINPGSQWREEIRGALEQARVAVLLVSANFLASEFIVKNELPPLLDAAKKEHAVILPVIVSPCRFKKTKSLSEFQAINPPEKTLLQMSEAEREELFVKVADAIENAMEKGSERRETTAQKLPVIEVKTTPVLPVVQPKPEEKPQPQVSLPDMVHIRGGWFEMGSSEGEEDEKPVHMVYVNDFFMEKYAVTRGEFRDFIGETDYQTDAETGGGSYVYDGTEWKQKPDASWLNPYFKQTNDHPVVCVSWNDAIAYCNWRSQKEGLTPVYTITKNTVNANFSANGYRLPTEAEWEYAARCGEKGYKYSWGDGDPQGKSGGNIADEALKRALPKWPWEIWKGYDDGYVYTAPVGSFELNDFGLYDMTGNAWEWCWDWYGKEYYKNSPKRNPQGPSSGDYSSRVVRGGA